MQLGLSDVVLWLSGAATSVTLLAVLIAKRRFSTEPIFCGWIAFDFVSTLVLFLVYRLGSSHLYFLSYWTSALLDLLLQVGVIAELAWSVFHRRGTWVHKAPSRFLIFAILALVSSLAVATLISPAAPNPLDGLFARASLFMTMVFCTGFLGLISVSRQLGVAWSARSMATGYGFFVWIIVSFTTDTLHTFWTFSSVFTGLEHARIIGSQLVVLYWTVIQFRSAAVTPLPNRTILSDMALLTHRFKSQPGTQVSR